MDSLNKINILIFQKKISEELCNNLTKQVCVSTGNILAIDYEIRLESTPKIEIYVNNCITKLKAFLGQKVITDDSFSTVLMLFAVAITSETVNYQDKNNIINKSEDIIIDTLINTNFAGANLEEKGGVKLVLKDLLSSDGSYDVMNFIQAEPKIFSAMVIHYLKQYKNSQEMINNIRLEIDKIVKTTTEHNKKLEIFKQATSKITAAICAIAVGAITVVTAGAAFALIVVPAAIIAVEYAPKIGEKIGEIILSADKNVTKQENNIVVLKTNIQKNINKFSSLQPLIQQELEKNNILDIKHEIADLQTQQLNLIKDGIKGHTLKHSTFNNNVVQNSKSQGKVNQRI